MHNIVSLNVFLKNSESKSKKTLFYEPKPETSYIFFLNRNIHFSGEPKLLLFKSVLEFL